MINKKMVLALVSLKVLLATKASITDVKDAATWEMKKENMSPLS